MKKLKGITEITLKDSKTGEIVSKTRDENMVTNAVADIMKANYNGQLDYGKLLPLALNPFGGLLCFSNRLEEDSNSYYIPLSNEITAHAGQKTYESAAADVKRGIPNTNLTKSGTNQYTLAWDFPVTQGNGTISAVALTSADFGDWGFWGRQNYIPFIFSATKRDFDNQNNNLNVPVVYDEVNRKCYSYQINGTTVTVRETPNCSILGRIGIGTRRFVGNTEESTDWTATLNRNFNNNIVHYDRATHSLHFLQASGNTIYRDILNLNTKAVTSSNMTVPNASLGNMRGDSHVVPFCLHLTDNGYFYWAGSNNKILYRIKYSNPSDVTECTNVDGVAINYTVGNDHITNGNVVSMTNILIIGTKFYECGYPTEANQIHRICNPFVIGVKSPVKPCIGNADYATNRNFGDRVFTPYLATINNLQTPVQKTPSQTMHVTYTLIEVDEEA